MAPRTAPLGAGSPATGLLVAVGLLPWLTTFGGTWPLSWDDGRLGLRRASPAQVVEPLIVSVIAEAAGTSLPLPLIVIGRRIPALLRDGIAHLILSRGSPWFRDGLHNPRSSRLGEPLSRRPILPITLAIRVLPAGVLPRLNAFALARRGFVVRGIGRPLVLLFLRPSAAHKVSYP